ncbi:MAG: DinB family protein [Cyclobacteriaceae bacterium]|nr:DinB family protein [Cyclobacteriaceae bacterium]
MSLLIQTVQKLLDRDLAVLEKEISFYATDADLWKIAGDIKNPAGNLCLHLCGNLQYYIGAVLGNSGYVRNRDAEFSTKGLSKEQLLNEIAKTRKAVAAALENLNPTVLETIYPVEVFKDPMTTGYFLIHLSAHLGYHLGQINYHRRLLQTH